MSFGVVTNRLNYVNTAYKPVAAPQEPSKGVAFKGIPNIQKKEMSSDNKLLLTLAGLALTGIGIYFACRGKTGAAQNTVRTASNVGSKTAANAANSAASSAGAKAASAETQGAIKEVANVASSAGTSGASAAISTVKPPIPQVQQPIQISSPVVPSPSLTVTSSLSAVKPTASAVQPRSITPVVTPPTASVPQKPVQSAATKTKLPQQPELSVAEIETRTNQLWESKQKEIEDAFSKKRRFSVSHTDCTMVDTSPKDHLLGSIERVSDIKSFGIEKGQNLYHGTSKEAASSIQKGGFDLSRCKRGEVGRGIYFGYDRGDIIKKYGEAGSLVTAKFMGNNVAQVKSGVYYAVANNTLFQMDLARKLALDWSKPQEAKILQNIISKYYNSILESRNIQGIVVKGSINAGLPYFMVPNTKYIQIVK